MRQISFTGMGTLFSSWKTLTDIEEVLSQNVVFQTLEDLR